MRIIIDDPKCHFRLQISRRTLRYSLEHTEQGLERAGQADSLPDLAIIIDKHFDEIIDGLSYQGADRVIFANLRQVAGALQDAAPWEAKQMRGPKK